MPETKDIFVDVNGRHLNVQIRIDAGKGDKKEQYEGPYTLKSVIEGTLIYETRNKVMTEDLVVLPIEHSDWSIDVQNGSASKILGTVDDYLLTMS